MKRFDILLTPYKDGYQCLINDTGISLNPKPECYGSWIDPFDEAFDKFYVAIAHDETVNAAMKQVFETLGIRTGNYATFERSRLNGEGLDGFNYRMCNDLSVFSG